MNTWRVETVTEKPGLIMAELVEVEWFKPNPSLVEGADEFIDAKPGDVEADCIEGRGRLTLEITDGPELHPLDHVRLTVKGLIVVDA